jgi:hypothetical protein
MSLRSPDCALMSACLEYLLLENFPISTFETTDFYEILYEHFACICVFVSIWISTFPLFQTMN